MASSAAITTVFHELIDEKPADGPFASLRAEAANRFHQDGLPSARTEDWRFTSIASLLKLPFRLASGESTTDASRLPPPAAENAQRFVFVNGRFSPQLSTLAKSANGVTVGAISQIGAEAVAEHLGAVVSHDHQPFAALNTALFTDAFALIVPAGRVIETPIEVLHVTTVASDAPLAVHPRVLLVLGRGSQAAVIERFMAVGDGAYFTNAISEIVLGQDAVLRHAKIQDDAPAAYHFGVTQAVMAAKSVFSTTYVGLGARWVRNEVRVRFEGSHAEATVNGVYLAAVGTHADNRTVIDHAMPECASHELYKGILAGSAHGVFNGKIFVRKDAQKTDAKQTNQTLLLSDGATINTKPQLEIFADDVKCTHGATVGQLDETSLFYLQSRGIGLAEAKSLLTFAFANDVVSRMPFSQLREEIERRIVK